MPQPGKVCCVKNCFNGSHTTKGEKVAGGFFRIPKVKKREGPIVEAMTKRRRLAWVDSINLVDINFDHSPDGARVCYRHFHEGAPAYEMFDTHPDWAPSLHMGHDHKETDVQRWERSQKRAVKKTELTHVLNEPERTSEAGADLLGGNEGPVDHEVDQPAGHFDASTQTELTGQELDDLHVWLEELRSDNMALKNRVDNLSFSKIETLQGDEEKVRFYTGLPSFACFLALLNYLTHFLPRGNRRLLSPFQQLILVFMRIRLNLPVQHIAHIFGVHRTTVFSTFRDVMSVMYIRLLPFVKWPEREQLQISMPHQFVEAFGKKVAIIIDCFEVFIEKPCNLQARAETFSNYKHTHTMKYLIGVTPRGEISFISNGWGGRSSDKHVTENSGFLNKLLPGDIILADRGFDIEDSVGLMYAEVKIPAFTRGQKQLKAKEVEETRHIAHLRIHVERVIGNLSQKYTILSDTLPIDLVLPCEGERMTFLDKIVCLLCTDQLLPQCCSTLRKMPANCELIEDEYDEDAQYGLA